MDLSYKLQEYNISSSQRSPMVTVWALLVLSFTLHTSSGVLGENVGICYGLLGDNLPPPKDVVGLYQKYGIKKMRIFEPNPDVLEALRGSDIDRTLGVRNQDIPTLASGEDAATAWFLSNVQPYINDINIPYIGVGNEVIPGEFSESILPAMQNLQNILRNYNLATKATTVVNPVVLGDSFPPSATNFSESARPIMSGITKYLSSQEAPLLVNLYPYFVYASNTADVRLDYAQFAATELVVQDGELSYSNLLDAMIDSFYCAMEKEGVQDVNIIVSESGWPHDGNGDLTTQDLARTYNKNYIHRLDKNVGTPKRPSATIQGFIFAMFDEDQKAPGVEQHWGIFSPGMQLNYDIFD